MFPSLCLTSCTVEKSCCWIGLYCTKILPRGFGLGWFIKNKACECVLLKNAYYSRDCSAALKQWLEGHMFCCGNEFGVLLFEVDSSGGENSGLFPSKWATLPAWEQMELGCFESRKKAKCIELGFLAACWHLLWTWAFQHKSLFTRTLLMLFCDCLLQITPFTFNLLEMDWTFSLLLEGAHFSDRICE